MEDRQAQLLKVLEGKRDAKADLWLLCGSKVADDSDSLIKFDEHYDVWHPSAGKSMDWMADHGETVDRAASPHGDPLIRTT
jgi:hypothetical protein